MLIPMDIMNKKKKKKNRSRDTIDSRRTKTSAAGKKFTTVYFCHSEVASLFVVPSAYLIHSVLSSSSC